VIDTRPGHTERRCPSIHVNGQAACCRHAALCGLFNAAWRGARAARCGQAPTHHCITRGHSLRRRAWYLCVYVIRCAAGQPCQSCARPHSACTCIACSFHTLIACTHTPLAHCMPCTREIQRCVHLTLTNQLARIGLSPDMAQRRARFSHARHSHSLPTRPPSAQVRAVSA
jgi:hypothetical protein